MGELIRCNLQPPKNPPVTELRLSCLRSLQLRLVFEWHWFIDYHLKWETSLGNWTKVPRNFPSLKSPQGYRGIKRAPPSTKLQKWSKFGALNDPHHQPHPTPMPSTERRSSQLAIEWKPIKTNSPSKQHCPKLKTPSPEAKDLEEQDPKPKDLKQELLKPTDLKTNMFSITIQRISNQKF